jgi:hypothetical protein
MKPGNHISCSQKCRRVSGNEPTHSQVGSHFWELKSQWTFECSKSDCKGQTSLDWYTIRKLLERKCLKWARMSHLSIWNTSYGRKKGQESKCKFDSWPLKVKNCPDLLVCSWLATYFQKAFKKGYNFVLDLISIRGLHKTLRASKVVVVPISRILGLSTWESRDKMTFKCGPRG